MAMNRPLRLPRADGTVTPYALTGSRAVTAPSGPIRSRVAFAAVHVVADPLAAINPTLEVALDWEATLAYRRYLWSLGLAVAEAMDTSQRGMGFDWETAKELIKRAVTEAKSDRKSTRLNSSHLVISYAVFCLKKKKKKQTDVMIIHQC